MLLSSNILNILYYLSVTDYYVSIFLEMTPAWFIPAMEALMPRIQAPILIAVSHLTNQLRDDGATIPFCSVPFIDGTDPATVSHPSLLVSMLIDHCSLVWITTTCLF